MALDVTTSDALREPVLVGVGVTATVQLAPTARDGPHSLTAPKSPGFVPERAIEVSVTANVPLLEIVTGTMDPVVLVAVEGKVILDGLTCRLSRFGTSAKANVVGGIVSAGWNCANVDPIVYSADVLSVGLLARSSSAINVFVGAAELVGLVSSKKLPQLVPPSFAVPPAEFTHTAIALPSESISATGTVYPVGTLAPGANPVVGFTYSLASVNAAFRAATSLVPDPIAEADVMYGASAFTAATVVSSLIMMNGVCCNAVHEPSAAIICRLLFVTPGLACPPVAVMYTSVALAQE
jgi:hypothetical protein